VSRIHDKWAAAAFDTAPFAARKPASLPRMSRNNLLLIEGNVSDGKTVHEALSNSGDLSFQVEWARSCAKGLELLASRRTLKTGRVAAILVDLMLPDSHGIETFDRLFRAAPHVPILILAGSQDEAIAKLAVQRGARDYVLKGRLDNYPLSKALSNMVESAAISEALFAEKERAQVTLDSIGDAVISTDALGQVTYFNAVAGKLTGWSLDDASGHSFEEVFHIIDATTREAVPNPMALAIRENKSVSLAPNSVLLRRDGTEVAIEDSAAPIHDRQGQVSGAVVVFHDVSKARALSLRMAYLAGHDSLTDLPNSILLHDRLTQAIALANRHRQKLAVLFLDVDRFKYINDSLGHAIGDRLLKSVAQRLLACVRASDTVSRQGGDEFVIVLWEMSNVQDAAACADKILLSLEAPHRIDDHELHLTASIGIATYPDDGTDAQTLMKNADSAMYHAKDAGRSNYQFFKSDMNARAVERHSIENDLRHALERQEFVLHYQPKMNLETRAIIGVEALIRWSHPQRGFVPPAQFIPVAEECGLIVPIGRWVLREACRQARAWQDSGMRPLRIAVNVSLAELRAKDFISGVRAILTETGLQPHFLELELTETFLMQDSKSTGGVLKALKDIGVHLALDDFGTGYSSLSYLKRFPIDTLKIDRSFVSDVATDVDDASIVSAVISMGESLHMRVVAEGVETLEQLAFLQEHSCPFGQGYFFSRPVTAGGFAQLLGRSSERAAATVIESSRVALRLKQTLASLV
jgi:diguanylate cyclase (GGDEF)-like protein/PAS domain S-box-containing protein